MEIPPQKATRKPSSTQGTVSSAGAQTKKQLSDPLVQSSRSSQLVSYLPLSFPSLKLTGPVLFKHLDLSASLPLTPGWKPLLPAEHGSPSPWNQGTEDAADLPVNTQPLIREGGRQNCTEKYLKKPPKQANNKQNPPKNDKTTKPISPRDGVPEGRDGGRQSLPKGW